MSMFENDDCGFLVSKCRKVAGTTGIAVCLLRCSFGAPFYLNPAEISVNCELRSSSGGNWQLDFNGSLLSKFLFIGFFTLSPLYQLVYRMLQHSLAGGRKGRMGMERAAERYICIPKKPHVVGSCKVKGTK